MTADRSPRDPTDPAAPNHSGTPRTWDGRSEADEEHYSAWFHLLAEPLLELLARVTGLDTTFITQIDWDAQRQRVVSALNLDDPLVMTGTEVDWQDSMCRHIFTSGIEFSSDVASDFPGSIGAETAMATFMALPVVTDSITIGTVCAASRKRVDLTPRTMTLVRLAVQAISVLLRTEMERRDADERAWQAHRSAELARSAAHELAGAVAELHDLATTDDVTGLPNRRGFTSRWEQQLATSGREHRPLGLIAVEVADLAR